MGKLNAARGETKLRGESNGDEELGVGSLSDMAAERPSFGFVKHFMILCLLRPLRV